MFAAAHSSGRSGSSSEDSSPTTNCAWRGDTCVRQDGRRSDDSLGLRSTQRGAYLGNGGPTVRPFATNWLPLAEAASNSLSHQVSPVRPPV